MTLQRMHARDCVVEKIIWDTFIIYFFQTGVIRENFNVRWWQPRALTSGGPGTNFWRPGY